MAGALFVDDGDGGGTAVGTTTSSTSGFDTSTTGVTAATTSTTATTLATTTTVSVPGEAPRTDTGASGLGSSGSGQVASGQGPTPETGAPEWLFGTGLAALVLAGASRRLSRASS